MAGRRQQGEGSLYQRASDGRWVGVLDLGWVGGKRIRKTVTATTLRELRPKFAAMRREVEAGVLTDTATVGQWLDHWLDKIASAEIRPRTLTGYRGYVETWLKPQLGKRRLDKLRPEHVRALHEAMATAGKSDATCRQAHMILRRALVVAEREGRIMRNPAALVQPPKVGQGRHDYLNAVEAKRVLHYALDVSDRARLAVALVLGLRQGEALGLLWEDVHLVGDGGWVHVHQAVQRRKGEGLVVVPVKSKASTRDVPLIPLMAALLREYRTAVGGAGYVFGGESAIDPRRDWQAWKDALARAGVKDVPLHGARASAATLLREAGASERVIADILGHAQVATTQAHYIRSDDEQRLRALDAGLGELLA